MKSATSFRAATILAIAVVSAASAASGQMLPEIARQMGGVAVNVIDLDVPVSSQRDVVSGSDLVLRGEIVEVRTLLNADGSNKWVRILNRKTLEIVDSVGGRAGHGAQEFFHIHSIAADSKGHIYLGEVNQGQRYMKYAFKGMGAPANPAAPTSTSSSR